MLPPCMLCFFMHTACAARIKKQSLKVCGERSVNGLAIYHCHCKIISRGSGRSAVGAAAYRSGEKLTNEYDGVTHDYTNKGGVAYSEILLPKNAPQEWKDRGTLWNEVESVEKGSRAQLAREYEVAIPKELKGEEQINLVKNFVKENFVDKGMCADVSIHDKGDGNPHAHILLTTRPIEQDGTWGQKAKNDYVLDKDGNRILQKIDKQNRKIYKRVKTPTTDWNTKEFLQRTRENWAAQINREMERKGLPQRVDHRSLADQKKEQIPTEHIGVAANAMEKRGIVSERGEHNRKVQWANRELKRMEQERRSVSNAVLEIFQEIKAIMEVKKTHQREAIKEKSERTDSLAVGNGNFSFTAVLEAQKEAFAESAAFHDTRRPASQTVLAAPQRLREAVAGLERAERELNTIRYPKKPNIFAGKAAKEKYEKELTEKISQRNTAESECKAWFEKVMSFGLSRYYYDRATDYSTEMKPPYLTAEEMKHIKDRASGKLKELETAAANERYRARPADAPQTTQERYRAAIERYRRELRKIPAERYKEAREALAEALKGYRGADGGADIPAKSEIRGIAMTELPEQTQRQEQSRQHVQTKKRTSRER